jgi:hypothetical protein
VAPASTVQDKAICPLPEVVVAVNAPTGAAVIASTSAVRVCAMRMMLFIATVPLVVVLSCDRSYLPARDGRFTQCPSHFSSYFTAKTSAKSICLFVTLADIL